MESRSESGQWSVTEKLGSSATGHTNTSSARDGTKSILRYNRVAAYMAFPFPNESYVNYGDADTLRTYPIERQISSETYSGTVAGTTSREPVYIKL